MSDEIDNALKEMREKYLSEKMAELEREILYGHGGMGVPPNVCLGISPIEHEKRKIEDNQ